MYIYRITCNSLTLEINLNNANSIISIGVFNGKDIARLMKSAAFKEVLTLEEKQCWSCVTDVITRILGKKRDLVYCAIPRMMQLFEKLNVHMSLKIHYMHCHLDDFLAQLSTESDEHGERFHQIAAVMEVRYKGKKLDALLGDLCWWIDKSYERDDDDDVDIDYSDIEEIATSSESEEENTSDTEEAMSIDASVRGRNDDEDDDDDQPRLPPKRRFTMI